MTKIIRGALALSMVTSMAMADMTTGMKSYVGAGVVMEEIEEFDMGTALELTAGTVFSNNFGVEAKLSKTIVPAEDSEDGITAEVDVMTISLFATYNVPLSPEFTLVPKVGFTNFSTDIEASNNRGQSASADDSNMNFSFGFDAKYSFSPTTNLYVGYTVFDPEFEGEDFDASHISFGLQQAF